MNAKILLVLICLLFIITRIYKILEIPSSVYWDEASIGYNAYSIVQTGKDEWGDFFPIHFRAFGEFKLPVYIYATVPFVKIFSLNEFSIRAPAVLFSLGVVIITFFLAKRLSGNVNMGLWSSFFITISPWFFIISRTGYEVTAGLMFYLLGIYIFLNPQKRWYILLSTLSFILSIYSYNSFRAIVPLTIAVLLLFQRIPLKEMLRKQKVAVLLSLTLMILSVLPIYRLYKYDSGAGRLQTVGSSIQSIIPNYLSHFNPVFLFLTGDKNLRSQQGNFGQLTFLDTILLPAGLLYIFKKTNLWILLPLILISPIPAAITKESPHALRSLSLVPFLSIVSALGVLRLKKVISGKLVVEVGVAVTSLLFFSYYFFQFLNTYPVQSSNDWQFGYKSIFTSFNNQFQNYDHVIISNQYAQPYIFALYYLKYNPNKFRQEVVRNSVDQWGFSTVQSFNNFIFTKIKVESLPKGKSLIFATVSDKLKEIPLKEVVLNLDNSVGFYVYEYQK